MSDRLITLLLVDDDPIFRLGLATALGSYPDLRVIDQTENPRDTLERLTNQLVDIVTIEPDFQDKTLKAWQLCQQIKQTYPTVKICLVSSSGEASQLQKFRDLGVEGYCPKGIAIDVVVEKLRQIAQGQIVWWDFIISSGENRSRPLTPRYRWLSRLQTSGLRQINSSLTLVNERLNQPPLSWSDKIFWQGRKRELLTARWLVDQLIPIEVIIISPELPPQQVEEQEGVLTNALLISPMMTATYRSEIFQTTLAKIQKIIANSTSILLEIDILQSEKKKELLTLVLNQFSRVLSDLEFIEPDVNQLPENTPTILLKTWRESTLSFLGKYCTSKQNFRLEYLEEIIDDYAVLVQGDILSKIPFMTDLLGYLLYDQSLVVEKVSYRPQSPEALAQGEKFLQNLVIQIANGIVSLILNDFSEIEAIKQNLFSQKLSSSREIARFRNRLAWKYRQEQYWDEPSQIFESQYRLFFLSEKGLGCTFIYSPRQQELKDLKGWRWGVTILLETHDAISPLLRAVVGSVGNGLVYVLTQVIGRGIGLVGRGIIKGVGSSWQDTRYGKKPERRDSKS